MSQFRPMLASNDIPTPEQIKFPVMVSPKVDGIRACIINGEPFTRKLKPFPNAHVAQMLRGLPPLDGELVVGEATGVHGFDASQSGIMSEDGEPSFEFHVFDIAAPFHERLRDPKHDPLTPFRVRLAHAHVLVAACGLPYVKPLVHFIAHDQTDLDFFEQQFLRQGYEGMMLRDPMGRYKYGRSTLNEGLLLKLVRKQRHEVIIRGFIERMHNENEKVVSELGTSKRSSHKANKTPTGMLGKFVCEWHDPAMQAKLTGKVKTFECGSGFDHEFARYVWENQHRFDAKIATLECREITKDGKPRFPVWKGLRHADDMGVPEGSR